MSMFRHMKDRAVEHLPAVADFKGTKHARVRLIALILMAGTAFSLSVEVTPDLQFKSVNFIRFLVLLAAPLFAWRLWSKSNRSGKWLAGVMSLGLFILSGVPSSKGGTQGEKAYAAFAESTGLLQGVLSDVLRGPLVAFQAWLRAKGVA